MDSDDIADYVEPVIALAPMKVENVMGRNGERQSDDTNRQIMARLGLEQGDVSPDRDNEVKKNYSVRKTGMQALGWSVVAGLVVIGASGVAYGVNAWNAGKPSITSSTGLSTTGKGNVESIDMRIQPVGISKIITEVTGTKTQYETDFNSGNLFGNIKIPIEQRSITRTTGVETDVLFDPRNMQVEWQPPKENAKRDTKNGQLYFKVPDAALSQKSNVLYASTTDHGGNVISMSKETVTAQASFLGSIFGGGAAEVPLLNKVAKGSMSVDNALENYSNFATKVNVGKYCTAAAMGVSHYTKDLKENMVTVGEGIMFSTDPHIRSQLKSNLGTMHKLLLKTSDPIDSYETLVQHAIVLLPGETVDNPNAPTTMKIPDDSADIKQMDKYNKAKIMTVQVASSSKMECDVSDAKLIENTKTDIATSLAPTKGGN